MTEAQRKRTDLKIIFWIYTSLFFLLFSWNIMGLLILSEFLALAQFEKPYYKLLSFREKLMNMYIDKRKIERDGKIGLASKFREKM